MIRDLPTLNACLNALAALCLFFGWRAIKRKDVVWHKAWMLTALLVSTLFLISYVYYHTHSEPTLFQGQGFVRVIYFFILITHVVGAIGILPFVVAAVYFAVRQNFVRHVRVTRVLWPVWMYVSVTGILVYVMLYRLPL